MDQNPKLKKQPQPIARYIEGRGARKTAVARVRFWLKKGPVIVNDKELSLYFRDAESREKALAPLTTLKLEEEISLTVKVKGGGIHAQAEAMAHSLANALSKWNPELKKKLRREGFVTRDARVVERKKYGLKKARRAPQWAKR